MTKDELLANPVAAIILNMIAECAQGYAIAAAFGSHEETYPIRCAEDELRWALRAVAAGRWTPAAKAFGEEGHGAGDAATAKVIDVFTELRRRVAELSLETTQVPS